MARPVPPSFLCPISLEVMKDPVTLSTGHTYDRGNIEKWLRAGHNTCPVTMMPLQDASLIPNVIVRRLIQAWCVDNGWKRSFKGENIIPSNCVDVRDCVLSFLKEIARGQRVESAVKGLKQLAKESENQTCIVSTGAPLLLVSLLCVNPSDLVHEECEACEDALSILALLCRSSPETKILVMENQKLSWIVWHLRYGCTTGAKLAAAALIRTLFKQDDSREAVGKAKGVFEGIISLLTEKGLSPKAEKSVVKVLERACESRANRVRAIEAGAVTALVDVLNRCQKASTERVLATMELLCDTLEGKDAASRLPGFFPALIERMVRVSHLSTEHAAACIFEVCSLNQTDILRSALNAGIYPQLLLVLQSDGTPRAKCKAQELLKRLHNVLGPCNA